MAAHQHDHDCGCHSVSSSVHQTLDEMEFERGLWSAALSGQIDDVKKHLQRGDDVNAKDKAGYTALHYAARNKHLEVCRILLTHGSDVNAATRTGKATPLHRAAYVGSREVVQLLLQCKADPLFVDADGMTPLHKAVEQGQRETAKILLAAGPAAVSVPDSRGRVPGDLTEDAQLRDLLQAGGVAAS
ncbi:putative palmitoyltransferase ZDHHC13 [Babylonia areolata]|uniref:putative palmitoyltransferase ZDHHC13 n=1 Tax=Babylonia areolata TaxID=304850 RepID=UPI003FD1AA73